MAAQPRLSVIGTLLLTIGLGACAATGEQPTPQIIYVTPVPSAVRLATTPEPVSSATPEPAPTATPKPTPKPTPTPTPQPVSYAKLTSRAWAKIVKDPDAYIGDTYQLWACIFQFDSATGTDAFLANASHAKQEYWNLDGDNSSFTGTEAALADFVEDDVVVVNVLVLGSYSYDTQAGGNTTVPSFEVKKITHKGSCD